MKSGAAVWSVALLLLGTPVGRAAVQDTTATTVPRPVARPPGPASDSAPTLVAARTAISVSLAGTVTNDSEEDIRAGGSTIVLTLTDDTWVAAGAPFDAQRQNIIDGIVSAGTEPAGWNNVVRAGLAVTAVVRTSSTVVTITLTPFPAYDITGRETVTATVPAAALVLSGVAVVAAPTFDVTTDQSICIPLARGVPALNNQPPRWWNADGDTDFPDLNSPPDPNDAEFERFDDPRWRGAVGTSAVGEMDFRAVHRLDSLFLSWEVNVDPGGMDLAPATVASVEGDAIWIGLRELSGRVVLLRLLFNIDHPAPDADAAESPVFELLVQKNDGTGYTVVPVTATEYPGWLGDLTRVWNRTVSTSGAVESWWAFQTVIPIKSTGLQDGIDLGDPFEMWYTVLVDDGVGLQQYHWPPDRDNITSGGLGLPAPSTSAGWGQFARGAGVTDCRGDVRLLATQIGTLNPVSSQILFSPLTEATNTVENKFFARPENLSPSAPLPAGAISARFFIANWGSNADWNEAPGGIPALWKEVTVGTPVNAGNILGGETAHGNPGRNDIQFPYTVPDGERCLYLPSTDPQSCPPLRRPHECVLAELASTNLSLVFANNSVYRNMDLESASTLKRSADISVVGLDPIDDGRADRDVYLYVQTVNMPRRIRDDGPPAKTVVVPRVDFLDGIPLDQGESRGFLDSLIGRSDTIAVPEGHTAVRAATVRAASADGKLGVDDIDSLVPTYRVHVYHATGDVVVVDGKPRPVLHAQTSFGYWVEHEGEVEGWKHKLELEEGAQLVEVAPNYYKIVVPNGGVAVVVTTIEALAPRRVRLSLHGGVSIPHGTFANTVDEGFGVTGDLGVRLTRALQLEGLFGYHWFDSAVGGGTQKLYHASGGLRAYPTLGIVRPFIMAGGGVYVLSPGTTEPGAHGGAGLQLDLFAPAALELSYTVHVILTEGSSTTFSGIQGGLRIRL